MNYPKQPSYGVPGYVRSKLRGNVKTRIKGVCCNLIPLSSREILVMNTTLMMGVAQLNEESLKSRLANPSSGTRNNHDAELKKVSQEFEAIFIQKLFETMHKTVPKSGLVNAGLGEDIFRTMQYREIASTSSQRGDFGLANLIYNSIKS